MDEFESLKRTADPPVRRNPQDAPSSDEEADSDAETTHLKDGQGKSHHKLQHDEIPGSGDLGMLSSFKYSSHLSGSFQTGVKGVLSDAISYETARRREKSARNSCNYTGYEPAAISSPPKDRSDAESGDDDFVKTWRKNRMQELRASTITRRRSPSKRKYGRVEAVDAMGYLDAVERVSSETIVVVVITNDKSEESLFVEDCLNTLSRRYVTTRFVKLSHHEAEMDSEAVPAVLAYKGGELFATIIRVVDEIPSGRSLSTESLELVLRRQNVLHKD